MKWTVVDNATRINFQSDNISPDRLAQIGANALQGVSPTDETLGMDGSEFLSHIREANKTEPPWTITYTTGQEEPNNLVVYDELEKNNGPKQIRFEVGTNVHIKDDMLANITAQVLGQKEAKLAQPDIDEDDLWKIGQTIRRDMLPDGFTSNCDHD